MSNALIKPNAVDSLSPCQRIKSILAVMLFCWAGVVALSWFRSLTANELNFFENSAKSVFSCNFCHKVRL